MWLTTNILQVGQVSLHSTVKCMRLMYKFLVEKLSQNWLLASVVSIWHHDISELQFNNQTNQFKNASAFGIIVDELTQGQIKNL
ncbi:14196_t:CDS:1, partial [Cetraspora pellucida]